MAAVLLAYENIERARRFFVEGLGFEQTSAAHDERGTTTRLHLRFADTLLMLGSPGDHGLVQPIRAGGPTHLLVIQVGDLEKHYSRAQTYGATIVHPPTSRPWGRDYELVDHEGYQFSFFETPAIEA